MIEPSRGLGSRRFVGQRIGVPIVQLALAAWFAGFFTGHWATAIAQGSGKVRLFILFAGGLLGGAAASGAWRGRWRRAARRAGPGRQGRDAPACQRWAPAIELQSASAGLAHKSAEAALRWESLAQASHALLGLLTQTLRDCRVALVRPVPGASPRRLEACAARPEGFDGSLWTAALLAHNVSHPSATGHGPVLLRERGRCALVMPVWAEAQGTQKDPFGFVQLLVEREGPTGFAPGELELVRTLGEQLTLSHKLEVALKSSQADLGRLAHLATTDGLTELHNRRHFEQVFALQLRRAMRYRRALSLLLIDIDHFKDVNDTFGHKLGDEVLQDVARLLLRTARCTDLVARYGGEEFVVLMDETDLQGARRTAERIRAALANTLLGHTVQLHKTACIGVAAYPQHGTSSAELLCAADTALYQAKRAGRDRIVLFDFNPAQLRSPG